MVDPKIKRQKSNDGDEKPSKKRPCQIAWICWDNDFSLCAYRTRNKDTPLKTALNNYLATWRYEISLWKRNFVSPRGLKISSILRLHFGNLILNLKGFLSISDKLFVPFLHLCWKITNGKKKLMTVVQIGRFSSWRWMYDLWFQA